LKNIGIIGAGNMGSALVRGLIRASSATPESISVFDVDRDKVDSLVRELGIRAAEGIEQILPPETSVIIVAVKPQAMGEVLESIAAGIGDDAVLISVAAGISTGFILDRIGPRARVIRAMPNAAAMVGASATALCKGGTADDEDIRKAVEIFSAVGRAVTVDEKLMNLVTGLSGSGPAYVFALMEAMTDAGVLLGLDRATARALTVQTVLGAATMAASEEVHIGILKDRITSPGGTTIAGLHVLERAGLAGILMDAVVAATRRGDELGASR
jgi:pyrroline-5-carboxylate reductase